MNLIRGKHTYGPEPKIIGGEEWIDEIRFGNFCSIAGNLQLLFRGSHMTRWVSTYPFQPMWKMDVPLHDLPLKSSIKVGNDVWIAENVKIRQGVTIGDGVVIAQESFVTGNIPPYALVGGNPAKIIRMRFSEKQISELLKISWWNWEDEEIKKVVPFMMSYDIDGFIKKCNEILVNKK